MKLFLFFHLFVASVFAGEQKKEIVIGTTVGDFADMVRENIGPQLEKKGYRVKLVEFTDFVRPNHALSEGAIDANVFQHIPYLEEFSRNHNSKLTPIVQVPTAPFALYSGKSNRLEELKKGSTVAVPNDPSNLARSLLVLQNLGWIQLKPSLNYLQASTRDILENPKGIKILQLEAAQLPRVRQDTDFVMINGNFAQSAGIAFTSALATEKVETFINWVVVREKDRHEPFAQDLISVYQSSEFIQYSKKRFPGYQQPKVQKTN
jgi:D-methionine transport system substrate-binding protein